MLRLQIDGLNHRNRLAIMPQVPVPDGLPIFYCNALCVALILQMSCNTYPQMKLIELPEGRTAVVSGIEAETAELEAKLREVGFAEGDEVEMLSRGPFGAKTLAVRLNRSIIALRGPEAAAIRVEVAP